MSVTDHQSRHSSNMLHRWFLGSKPTFILGPAQIAAQHLRDFRESRAIVPILTTVKEATMKLKTTLAATVLALMPGLAFAYECNSAAKMETASISCAEGMVVDAATNTCVATTG